MVEGHVLAFGELLWDLLPTGKVVGGAPGNFCFRLAELGVHAYLVSRVGDDALGKEALSLVEKSGVNTSLVQHDLERPTGTVDVTIDSTGNASFTIIPNVAYDFIAPTDELLDIASRASLIYFGTLAQRCPKSQHTLTTLLNSNPSAIKFFDINLRKDCFSRDVIERSLAAATIAKLNHEELFVLAKMLSLTGDSIPTQAEALRRAYDLDIVAVTLAERGVIAVSRNQERMYIPGYSVQVVDTIGSGDAFSAAFCSKLLNASTLRDACEFGNRLGALVAQTKGAMTAVPATQLAKFGSNAARIRDEALECTVI